MDDKDDAWNDKHWEPQPSMFNDYAELLKALGLILLMFLVMLGTISLVVWWVRWLF